MSAGDGVALIGRSVLFGIRARTAPALAPAGDRLAYLAPHAGASNLWVGTSGGRDFRPVTAAARDILSFEWAGDGRHLLYVQDGNGDENTHLLAVDQEGGQVRDLTPFQRVQAGIVGRSGAVPSAMLIVMNRRSPGVFDVFRVELASGELELVMENPGFSAFVADRQLRLAAAIAPRQEGGGTIMVPDAGGGWRPLVEVEHEDYATLRLAGVTAAGKLVVLSSSGARSTRLVLLDPQTGQAEVVYEDPGGHDVIAADLDPRSGRPRLAVVERERQELEAIDNSLIDDVKRLQAACHGEPRLLGRDQADRRWLVLDNRDDAPAGYHLYDRATGELSFLFHHLPELVGQRLAAMEPFSFRARDGLLIHGYASYPPGQPRHRLPTVVEIHGGPWTRDRWGFRVNPQWLANRGYLCVQVNYRGSTGYGRDFMAAGDREWGGKMLTDVLDAVSYLVAEGVCDPRRVGAYGSSYGGYAALCAAAFAPGVFSCAACFAAPTDLRSFIASMPGTWNPAIAEMHSRVGHPVRDADFLWSRSAMSRVDEIGIPLLIAHGANDPRVRLAEAERLIKELRARGVPHEFLVFPDEGHYLSRAGNRLAFYAAAERFFARHLGGRCEPLSQSEQESIAAVRR